MKLANLNSTNMTITEILKHPYINISAIAHDLWPDKPKANATALLHSKLGNKQGNRITEEDEKKIKNILKNICIY